MHVYSTNAVELGRRLDYWSALSSSAITPMQVSASSRARFEGRLWVDRLGSIDIARAYSSSAVIRRTPAEIGRTDERAFLLELSEDATYGVCRRGQESVVKGGEFWLSDSTEPIVVRHLGCSVVVLRIGEAALKAVLPGADQVLGVVIKGDRGAGLSASTLIRGLARTMQQGFARGAGEHLATAVLHALAAAFAEVRGVEVAVPATAESRRLAITKFVDAHLGDADLKVQRVAERFGVSDRYVRMLFEAAGEPLSTYIQRRRLEESARQLRDPQGRSLTVSEIAFSWGFNSLGSYDRAFKAHFDVTPREYRSRHQAAR
jgi:AraC-like DNA-binding protein